MTERMSPLDHLLWVTDAQSDLRSAMTSVAVFEGPCDREAVRARFDRACRRVPKLRQRVEHAPLSVAPPRWETDPAFDLDRHLTFTSIPGSGLREALDLAATQAETRLPTDHPLWYATAIDGLADGGWALIMRAHHALADGLGALEIQLALFDLDTGEPPASTPAAGDDEPTAVEPAGSSDLLTRSIDAALWEARRGFDLLDRGVGELGRAALAPRAALRRAADTAASLGRTLQQPRSPGSPVMSARGGGVRLDALELPLAELKAAARRFGTRLNAVFLAGYAQGLGGYHRAHGADVEALHLGLPVSTRVDSAAGGNHILPVRIDLPVSAGDPGAHARSIEAAIAAARAEPSMALLPDLVGAATRLPPPLVIRAYREAIRGIDVQASNLPGSPFPAVLAGSRLVAQYPFGPLAASACNLTLLSYCDDAHLGLTTSRAAVPDPDRLVEHLRVGFDTVLDI